MAQIFDGKKVRDQILDELKVKVAQLNRQPVLAVLWIGDDFASARYIEAKQRASEKIGIHFDLIKYSDSAELVAIKQRINDLNNDPAVTGVMIQIPVPKKFDLLELIGLIDSKKDIDGLRFCGNLSCDFRPPVTLSILEALSQANVNLSNSIVTVIGKGFLVGSPIARILESKVLTLRSADLDTPYLGTLTIDADVIITATGMANIITPEIIKKGVVLIDAGTTEVGGKLAGDIDPACYEKASFYTPVPGGIGPVTVAMLMKNVVGAISREENKNNLS